MIGGKQEMNGSHLHYPIARKESEREEKKEQCLVGGAIICALFRSRDYWMLTQILLQLVVD